jgi:hypothetical protein
MSENKHELAPFVFQGHTIPVSVTDSGNFSAGIDGITYQNLLRHKLEEQLRTVVKRRAAKVAVPFCMPDGMHGTGPASIRRGTATGLHATSGKILVRWADGEAGQIGAFSSGALGDLTDEERALGSTLAENTRAARQDFEGWCRAHAVPLNHLVDTAIRETAGG